MLDREPGLPLAPELQYVPSEGPAPREQDRWPSWIIINPPIDSEGRFAPLSDERPEWSN
jgi:hypothetical protein